MKLIDPKLLNEHPLNRKFPLKGAKWTEFVASVKEHGVQEALLVRKQGKSYQVLAGHRRLAAAKLAGLDAVPCEVKEVDDRDALLLLINSNLQRENPNIVEDARLIKVLGDEFKMDAVEISEKLSRTQIWVTTRQRVFDFDEEVIDALQEEDESRRLSEGAFRQILAAPAEIRERAVQLVLKNEAFDEPLSEQRAKEEIQFVLIPEWKKEKKWEEGREKLRAKVATEMRKACLASKPNINVQVQPWERGSQGVLQPRPALGVVSELLTDDAPQGLKWIDLAERMNSPIYVIPPTGEVVVSGKQIMDFEATLRDFQDRVARGESTPEGDVMKAWLAGDVRRGTLAAVAAAVSAVNGEGDPTYDEGEPAPQVATPGAEDGLKIEQKMDHHAWMDIGEVIRLRDWAHDADRSPDPMPEDPEWVPVWAQKFGLQFEQIKGICNWFLGLKQGGGK